MIKRIFDVVFSVLGLLFFGIIILVLWIIASIDTKSNGFFVQNRIGQFGKSFKIFKIKSINDKTNKISNFGNFIRRTKVDEMPQFYNILIGDMSFVGSRPDIAGYYDELKGENRKILNLKPGLTSLASIKYANEDEILAQQLNPLQYNDEIIFPDKLKMNLEYAYNQTFIGDLKIIFRTIFR